jgi:hypothetical protein
VSSSVHGAGAGARRAQGAGLRQSWRGREAGAGASLAWRGISC